MGDAQAIPENLFAYSDQTTSANSDVATWIRNVLAPAVEFYRETAVDLGDGIAHLTLVGTGSIDTESQTQLTTTYETDRHVRVIGQAFLDAANSGNISDIPPGARNRLPPDQSIYSVAVVTTDDRTIATDAGAIDNEDHQLAEDSGRELAQYVKAHGFDDSFMQQIKQHQKDPFFWAGFYNTLTPDELQRLTDYIDGLRNNDQAGMVMTTLVLAYESGALDTTARNFWVNWLLTPTLNSVDAILLFETALAQDPKAALNFVDSLSDAQLAQFAQGMHLLEDPGGLADSSAANFMYVCAAALQATDDPAQLTALMDRFYTAYHGTQPQDMSQMLAPLSRLLATFEAQYLGHPPVYPDGPDKGMHMVDWIHGKSATMAKYAQEFGGWIYDVDGSNNSKAAFQRSMIENMVMSGLLAALPLTLPLGVAGSVTLAMGEAAATGWFQPWLDSELFAAGNDPKKQEAVFLAAQVKQQKLELVLALFSEGQLAIRGPNGTEIPITLESTGCSSDDQLVNWMLHQNPDSIVLTGTQDGTSLRNMLDAVGDENSYFPPDSGLS